MATFTNKATLSYVGGTVDSNTVTGEILEVLYATKTAVRDVYAAGDRITYVISLRNTGTAAIENLVLNDDLQPCIRIRYADPMTSDKLWELMTMDTWTITYKADDVRQEGAKFSFKTPGKVYKY